jgi:3-hydroxybutyryl-CoA dehydrogenase
MSYCRKCDKHWNYTVEKCIFCGNATSQLNNKKNRVIGYTKVSIPSAGNEKVPYFVYFLEAENGIKSFKKSYEKFEIGDVIDSEEIEKNKMKIGVVGTGLMGSQIAEYLILHGYETVLKTRDKRNKDLVFSKIEKRVSKGLSEIETSKCLQSIQITGDYVDLSDCDIVIDASAENIAIKKEVFKNLSSVCGTNTTLATNSSSISIDEIAASTSIPENCIGIHFFNPVRKMDLVEIVIGEKTSEEVKDRVFEFIKDLGKNPIFVKNSPGFIVNRLLLPQINEAVKLLEAGIASKEDIDMAVKLGLNHPMGPFELADFIGLDTCVSILEILSEDLINKNLKPAGLLYNMVKEGKLGYKSKEGFYKY